MAQPTWLDKADSYLAAARLELAAGYYDSVVSRAYYAARYACLELLADAGIRVDPRWKHKSVLDRTVLLARDKQWLRQLEFEGRDTFSKSLDHLLTLREQGDYQQEKPTKRVAERAVDFVDKLIRAIREETR